MGKFPSTSWAVTATVLVLLALSAFVSIVLAIDPAGDYPRWAQGPGLTLDESFNVDQGVILVEALHSYGFGLLHPDSVREVFGNPAIYLSDHPPLGRLWIGLCHNFARVWFPPANNETPYVVAGARTAPASAFALLVLLIGWTAYRWHGPVAGISAAASLILMPRMFGHAHLAALESFIGLTYAAAVLSVAACWTTGPRPSMKAALLSGAVFGLALLTKIQAILLPVPVLFWALACWRGRALRPLVAWGVSGLLVFFACWPWLWLDPVEHLMQYLARTTQRETIHVWYFGARYADVEVPWHYPAVMFLITVPVGLLAFGFAGLLARRVSPRIGAREWLVLACLAFPLIVFALPGVAVYDGTRLFLVSLPLWALLAGRGAAAFHSWLRVKCSPGVAGGVLVTVFVCQGYGLLVLHPCYLSYYNALVGGLRGAEALGLEVTYWGDSLTRSLLRSIVGNVPRQARVELFPVLHPAQLDALLKQSPILRRHGIQLAPYRGMDEMQTPYLVVFRRQADLPDPIRGRPPRSQLLAEVRREGVQLAALFKVALSRSPPKSSSADDGDSRK